MMDMLTNVDVGLIVIDASHEVQMWNRFMEDHSGILENEAKYKNIFGLFPELPEEWFRHKINSVFTLQCRAFSTWEQRPYLFKFKNYRPITGTEEFMYQNTTMIPLVSADGVINHVCLLVYDVTDEAVSQKEMLLLNNKLEQISRTDRLTELNNRGFWEESFQLEFDRCKRYKTVSSALIFDIDHFKKVNDTYGHQAGDEVIRKTAEMVRNMIRKTDVAGRYGGEEFVIYLPNTAAENAKIFAERLRQNIQKMEVKYEALHIKITISIGICEFHESLASHEKWIEEADKALYLCKEQGRNQTRIASLF